MTTRSWVWILALCLVWTGLSGRAAAGGSTIASSMGDLRWGMTESEVVSFLKRKIGERYADQIKKANGSKQAALREQMKREQAEAGRALVTFEGSKSRWDSSPVAGEFNYGDDQSMLTSKDEGSQNFYFFRDGRLWKWYKALDKGMFKGGDFKKFSSSVESKFGKGRAKKGELSPGQGETQWIEYLDRSSRLRAADNTKRGVYALIFEEMAMVRELAALRPTKPSRLGGGDDEEADSAPAKLIAPAKSGEGQSEVARASTKRSIFGNEQREESESDYQSRKQRTASETRDRQAREHARKQDAKQGETLKQLDKIEDNDPLGGL